MDLDNIKTRVIYSGLPTGFQGSTVFFFYFLCFVSLDDSNIQH